VSCVQTVKEKESFLFTQSKIGAVLSERFYLAVKGNIGRQLHRRTSYLPLSRGFLSHKRDLV